MVSNFGQGLNMDDNSKEDFFSTALDVLDAVVLLLDRQFRVVFFNKAAEKVAGYTFEELKGKLVWDYLIIEEEVEGVKEQCSQLKAGDFPNSYENYWKSKDGKLVRLAWSNSAIVEENGEVKYILGTATDITERRRLEKEAAREKEIVDGINCLLREAIVCKDEENVAKVCLEVAESITGSKFGFIGEVNEKGTFDTIALSDPGWDECRIPETNKVPLIKDMIIRGIWGVVIKTNAPLITNKPMAHPESVRIPKGHPPINSFMGVPLKYGEKTIGMIALANKEKGYDEKDVYAIEKIASAFIEALYQKRNEIELDSYRKGLEIKVETRTKELRERMKELQCLYNISHLVEDGELTDEQMYQEIVDMIPPSMQYPEVTVARLKIAGIQYLSKGFIETQWALKDKVTVDGEDLGILEIHYTKEMPESFKGPFLKEEVDLIEAISERIEAIISKKKSKEEIEKYQLHLEELVKERTLALENTNSKLQEEIVEGRRRQMVIEQQAQEIIELSTPVIRIWEGIVVAPLVGMLDSNRTRLFMERVLETIVKTDSPLAIIDITGVPTIDTQTAQHLIETMSAVKMLGAEAILTGISPGIAQTLIHLGIDLASVHTHASLSMGLKEAFKKAGVKIS